MRKTFFCLSTLAFLYAGTAVAAPSIVAERFAVPADVAAEQISQHLTELRFKVIDNLDVIPRIQKGNPQLAAKIPAGIQAERLLVVCKSTAIVGYLRTDPSATSLCPLTISLVQENGRTTAYYLQRSEILPDNDPAKAVGQEVDRAVLEALHAARDATSKRLKKPEA